MEFLPMLTKLGSKEDLSKKGFIFEPKLDGTRAICYFENGEIRLINRRDRDITHKYPEFVFNKLISARSCVLDGEIIVYDENGNPNFNLLQSRDQLEKKLMIELRSKEQPAAYVVFDILEKDGKDLTNLSLMQRKKILDKVIKESNVLEKIFFTENGKKLWNQIKKRNLEGVVGKVKESKYYPGKRTPVWLKIKFLKTLDAIVIGFTKEKREISALVLAAYHDTKIVYLGKVAAGLSGQVIEELSKKLQPTSRPAIKIEKERINYVKPEVIVEIKYMKMSKNFILRVPVFLRTRNDKLKEDCIV